MPGKRANPQRIKLHYTYSVEDAALALGVHKNTVRGWRDRGLEPIDGSKPMLFAGDTLREFLKKQIKARKQPCRPGELYCLKCREPRQPAEGMVDYQPLNALSGNLKALCGTCGTIIHRRAALAKLDEIIPEIDVHITGQGGRIS